MSLQLPACYLLGMVQHILDQSGVRPSVHRDSEAVVTATATYVCVLGTNRNAVHQYRPIVELPRSFQSQNIVQKGHP